MTRSLALVQSGLVDKQTLDELIRASIFFGDTMLVRASYEVPRVANSDQELIVRKLAELEEMGVLKYWAHEYEADDGGKVRTNDLSGASIRVASSVLDANELREALGELDDVVQSGREEAYLRHGPATRLRQGPAEFVGFREQLISLVIASELRQDGLLSTGTAKSVLKNGVSSQPGGTFRNMIVKEVIDSLGVGPLWHLSAEQIDESRKFSRGFSEILDQAVLSAANGVDAEITPKAVAENIVSQYREIFKTRPISGDAANLTSDMIWDLSSAIIPPTLILKYGLKAFKWRREAKKLRPFLMLSSIQSRTI